MTVTFYELGENEYTQIGTIEDGKIVEGEEDLQAIGADQFVDDEERLLRVYDGPYIVAGIGDSKSIEKSTSTNRMVEKKVEAVMKEWVPYQGPNGGEGWQNTLTGEIRYQEQKPTGQGGSGDADITMPNNSTLETVSAAITSVLGATVLSALKDQATGGQGGTINPEMLVTAAAMYIVQTGKGSLGELQEALEEESEDRPEDSTATSVSANGHEVEMTTATGVTDVTGAITEATDEETLARLSMAMDDEEEERPEAWVEHFLERVDEDTVAEFQESLDARIHERTISTDKYRGGVVVPKELEPEEARQAAQRVLDPETYEFLEQAVASNPSVDESNAQAWVKATLTQIGDDNDLREEYQNQFDVSVTEEEEEPEMVVMEGGGESIEMPTGTSSEDARRAIEETLGEDFLKHTAGLMEDEGMDIEDPKNWIMTSLTLSQIANPEGFENTVTNLQDSLIDEEEADEENGQSRTQQLISEHESEGDWQSFVDPVTDLLEEGKSASDITQALKENAQVGEHGLQDEQIRQIAFDAHREATERNAPIPETADNPTLAMGWGNEFPEAMTDRFQENFPDEFEKVEETFGMWSEDPHGPEMASMWNYVMNQTGNGNVPEGIEGDPEEEAVQAIERMHQVNQDTLSEVYGDQVPVFRPITGEAANRLKSAKEEDEPVEFSHRPAESWSSDIQQLAERTGFEDGEVAVIRREAPTENVMASSLMGNPGMETEDNQFVVMSEEHTEYETDNILTGEDLKDADSVMEQVAWASETAGGNETEGEDE